MTIQLTAPILEAGVEQATGTQLTLSADREAELVNRGVASYVGDDPTEGGLVPFMFDVDRGAPVHPVTGADLYPLLGEIALYAPDEFVGGVAQGSGQNIPSSALTSASTGTPLQWSNLLFDTTPGGVWDIANPSRITVPVGATKMWVVASIMFPPNATGSRWLRLLDSALGHKSNFLMPVAHATLPLPVPLNTGWIDVIPGSYFTLNAIQDSGVTLVPALGSVFNKGGSTFARIMFR